MNLSAEEITAAYEAHGSKRAAAQALGVPRRTFVRWMQDIEREGKPRLRVRGKWAEREGEKLMNIREWPPNRPQVANRGQNTSQHHETVVYMPDRHSPYEDKRAIDVAINYCHKKHRPTWVVDGGDGSDMYEFSSFIGASRMDAVDELYAAVRGLEYISDAFRGCKKTFLVGNHERRLVRYMQTNIPKLEKHRTMSIYGLLELERLGYEYWDNRESWEREGKFFKIGKLTYIHGDELKGCGYKYAAQRMAELYRANIIFGHLHVTDASKPIRDLEGHVIRTWGVGCLHTVTPHYHIGASHNLGFAVVEYDEDGSGSFTVYNYLLDDNYKVRL